MYRCIAQLHFFFLFFSVPFFGLAQSDPFPKYVSQQWSMDEGLPQSSVNDILQSRDGYLWLATFGGLVRFNGTEFTVFDRSNTTGLRSDRILGLYEDRSGAIWCGTEEGYSRFKDGVFTTYFIRDDGIIYSPLMVTEDARGTLWISAHGKPYRFANDSFIYTAPIQDAALAAKAVKDPGGILMTHGSEILRTIGDSIVTVKDFSGTFANNIQAGIEFPEGSGTFWMATSGDGIVQYANGTVRRYLESDGVPSKYMRRIFVDRSKTLWVLGFNGISQWNGERFIPLRTVDGIADKEFNVMAQDVEGNYWAGTPANGLFRMRPSVIRTIGPEEGLMEGKMLSLTMRKDGSLLFGTNCGGVYEWRNGKASYSALNKHLINLCVWSILEDSKQRIWTGSRQLTRFDDVNGRGIVYDSSNGFDGLDIFAIMEDRSGILWIGCLNGLFRYDGKIFSRFTTADGMPHIEVRSIFQDRSGAVWIGTADGVCRYVDRKFLPVRLDPSDTTRLPVRSRYIRAIHEDAEGTMWFGTYGEGIIRLKEERISVITTKQGLFDNIVSHIVEDEQGNFWMGCNRGLFRVSKEDLNNAADRIEHRVQSSVFGTTDGMKTSETNGGFQPTIVRDTSGQLYVPTVNGVVVVSTRKVKKNELPPPVIIEKITAEGKRYPSGPEITLPYDSATIQITYTALSFTDPKMVRFKYRLIGYDKDWNDAGTRRTAYYTKIPPGTHTFQVIAANNNGVWNSDGDSIRITITPPFWKTWWFFTVMGLLFAFSGPYIYYFRVTQLKKEKQAQQEFSKKLIDSQERERRRIAMELHDGIGQQILVIKNRVELALKDVANVERTADQLREIAHSATSSINDVRSISHGLRPVHLEQFGLTETVKYLCEQLRSSSEIDWTVHVDDIDGLIPRDKEINFYRILQEGSNNITRHSSATQASIMIRRTEKEVVLSLWDNGIGFDLQQKKNTASMGLSGIKERVNSLGGVLDISSQKNEGTTLKVIISTGQYV